MTKPQEPHAGDDFLVRIARFHRSNIWRSAYLLPSVLLASADALMLLYPVSGAIKHGWSSVLDNLVFGQLGFVGILMAWFIRIVLCLSRVASPSHVRRPGGRNGRLTARKVEECKVRKSKSQKLETWNPEL